MRKITKTSQFYKCCEKKLATMRNVVLLLFFSMTQVLATTSYSQTARLSLNMKNATIKEVFKEIEANTEFYFLYNSELVDVDKRVNIVTKEEKIENILNKLFSEENVNVTYKDRHIIISPQNGNTSKELQRDGRKLTGKVTSASDKLGLPGVNVFVKGNSKIGTSSDINGNYSLQLPANAVTIVFSAIGMQTIELPVEQASNVVMKENSKVLDEVVVIGYGTQKKESLTGALQTLKKDKLENITTPAVENLLNGKVAGVFVAPGAGRPGSSGAILVRGKSTINGSTAPLWVVDGVILGSSPGNLSSADIESMSILKDAASTAIYGSQGANGVILVTTKRPISGKMSISACTKLGFSKLNNGNLKLMNGAELYDYYKSFTNADQIAFPRWNEKLRDSNFNWWKLATQTGVVRDYNVSISGGTQKLKAYFSLNYYDEKGAVKGYDYDRFNFRLKTIFQPFEWLSIKPYLAGSKKKIDDRQYSVTAMYSNLPWDSAYDENGNIIEHKSSLWVNSNSTNYLYDLQWNHGGGEYYEIMGNFDFDIKITDYLKFISINSYKWNNDSFNNYLDPRSSSASGVKGRLSNYSYNIVNRYTNQLLEFRKSLNLHSFYAIVAYEFKDYAYKKFKATGTGFIPGFEVLDVTAKPEDVGGGLSESAMQSFLSKANYTYSEKYIGELSLRRDGASNFGNNSKYGTFFSLSGAWNIHKEKWFKSKMIDLLKLRISHGSVGSKPRALYPQYDLYSVSQSYNEISGALISQIGDKNVTWEKTYTTGLGVDMNILQRLRLTLDLYEKKTSNLLYPVPVPGITGVTSRWKNVGELSNKGLELTANADIIKSRDWLWNFDFNIGANKNKILSLYSGKTQQIISDGLKIAGSANKLLKPGLDSDTFYMREWAGVNPENGSAQWYKTVTDSNGNSSRELTEIYAEADEVTVGTSTPDFFGGFSTSLSYKNFEFAANFGYSVGGDIYNYSRQEYDSDGAYTDRNQMKLMGDWNRWEKPGDIATHPVASYNNSSNSNKVSSRYLEDGSFLKLRSTTFSYSFEYPKLNIKKVRLFVTGENLFCLTNYSGVDPEVPVKDGIILGSSGPGVYPSVRKYMFGINLTF